MFTDTEPGADPRLAAVFSAAKAPAELPLSGEEAALAAYRRITSKPRLTLRLGTRPAQLIAAALFGGVVVAGGVATAATGSLPIVSLHQHHATHTQVQPTNASDTDADSADGTDTADEGTTSGTDLTDTGGPGTDGHPAVLGSVARGIETCTQASQGTCQAGQHGKALAAHDHHGSATLPSAATAHRSGHAAAAHHGAWGGSQHGLVRQIHAPAGTSHRKG
jgi:hypothetical protein